QKSCQVQVEALFALHADLKRNDHVIRRIGLGHVHADIRDVQLALDAVGQRIEQRLVEILARDLTQLGAQRFAQLGTAPWSRDADLLDDEARVYIGGSAFLRGLVGEREAPCREDDREDSCQQQLVHT